MIVVPCRAMQTSDFDYILPEDLIAQYPLPDRTASALLYANAEGVLQDKVFSDIGNLIEPGDLLVFNNTRVIPARLHGQKSTGGKIEVLVERILDEQRLLAHIKASKSPKPGTELLLESEIKATMVARQGDLFELQFDSSHSVLEWLDQFGHMPLPPYIEREDDVTDQQRYQTVYAKHPGAVAAPTAGLHFDQPLLNQLQQQGVQFAYVTLHVGAGTFQPVRVDNINDHHMHAEYIDVDQHTVDLIKQTRANGKTSDRSRHHSRQKSGIGSNEW